MPNDQVVLEGWNEFLTSLRDIGGPMQREVRKAFRDQARRIVARADTHAAHKSGDMAQHTTITLGPWRLTITWTEPYAGVQEWAVDYERAGTRGGPVHMTGEPPPRFARKAWREMRETFEEEMLDAIADAAASSGYWEVTR